MSSVRGQAVFAPEPRRESAAKCQIVGPTCGPGAQAKPAGSTFPTGTPTFYNDPLGGPNGREFQILTEFGKTPDGEVYAGRPHGAQQNLRGANAAGTHS